MQAGCLSKKKNQNLEPSQSIAEHRRASQSRCSSDFTSPAVSEATLGQLSGNQVKHLGNVTFGEPGSF